MYYKFLLPIFAAFLLQAGIVAAAPTTPTSVFDATVLQPAVTNGRMNVQVNISQSRPAAGGSPVTLDKLDLEGAVDGGNFTVIGTKGPVTPPSTTFFQYIFSGITVPCNKNIQIRFKLYAGVNTYSTRTINFVTCSDGGGTQVLPDGTFILQSRKGGSYTISAKLPQPGDFAKTGTTYQAAMPVSFTNNTSPRQTAVASYELNKQGELPISHDFNAATVQLRDMPCSTMYEVRLKVTEGTEIYRVPQTLSFNTPSCDGGDTGGATDGAVTVTTSAQSLSNQPKVLLTAHVEVPNYSNFSGRTVTYGFEMKSGSGAYTQVGAIKTSTVTGRNATVPTEQLTAGDGTALSCTTTYTFRAYAKMNSHQGTTLGDSKYVGNEATATTGTCQNTGGASGGGGGTGGPGTVNDSGEYQLLVPSLPIGSNGKVAINASSGISSILQQIFNIILVVAIVLSVILIIYGGAKYATSDAAFSLAEGKKIITNAVTGLAFALFSWLLLNTLNTDLIKATLVIPPIAQQVTADLAGSLNGGGPTGGGTGSTTPPVSTGQYETQFQQAKADDQRVRNALVGISINHPTPCSSLGTQPRGTQGCTLVGNLGQSAITNLVVLKNKCGSGCVVEVTGGTEWWLHGNYTINQARTATNHYPGNSVVDISKGNTVLNAYIGRGNRSSASSPFDYKITGVPGVGGTFYSEGDHWHVQF